MAAKSSRQKLRKQIHLLEHMKRNLPSWLSAESIDRQLEALRKKAAA